MTIFNMTPHFVSICNADGLITKDIPPTGNVIRLKTTVVTHGNIDDVRITGTIFGAAEGLPSYNADVYYIVSQLVKNALPGRNDLLVPAEVVRDTKGNIIGCQSLGI